MQQSSWQTLASAAALALCLAAALAWSTPAPARGYHVPRFHHARIDLSPAGHILARHRHPWKARFGAF